MPGPAFSLPFTITERDGLARDRQVVEQGLPVPRLVPDEVAELGILGQDGAPAPGEVAAEAGHGPTGAVAWVRVTLPATLAPGETARYTLGRAAPSRTDEARLALAREGERLRLRHAAYDLALGPQGQIALVTPAGTLLDGPVAFELIPDARTSVGPTAQLNFQPQQSRWEVLAATAQRVHLRLHALSIANQHRGEPWDLDPARFYRCTLDLVCTAWAPEIVLQWRLTSHVPTTVWLERYALVLPAAAGAQAVAGERSRGRGALPDKYRSWAAIEAAGATGATLGVTAAFAADLGPGAGIKLDRGGRLLVGGINPPIDGGFAGRVPDLHRDWRYGMSRTFTGHLIPAVSAADAERRARQALAPLCLVAPAAHYSRCGALPEAGDAPTDGPWGAHVRRAMRWLIRHQWRGTLWWGEWWREWDTGRAQGVEEAGNGESATAPLFHFFRTGDPEALACARRAAYGSHDLLLCKREDGCGPYVRSRRFVLDGLEWVHGRYQRVAGMMLGSHVFCDARMRDEVAWALRSFATNFVRDDGVILAPPSPIAVEPAREGGIDMVNLAESLLYAYAETGDGFYLDKARAIGTWLVRTQAQPEWRPWNDNLTRYLGRGMLALTLATGDPAFRESFLTLERQTQAMASENGHSTLYHCWLAAAAERLTGDRWFVDRQGERTAAVLAHQAPDGGFRDAEFHLLNTAVYLAAAEGKRTSWVRYYGSKSTVAYVPVLAARLAALNHRCGQDGDGAAGSSGRAPAGRRR